MIKRLRNSISSAVRLLFGNRGAALMLLAVSLALGLSIYGFVSTREANVPQVILTIVLGVAVPVVFFTLQVLSIQSVSGGGQQGARLQLAMRGSWKLLVITVPFALLAWLMVLAIDQLHQSASSWAARDVSSSMAIPAPPPASASGAVAAWWEVAIMALRVLVFGFVLPLLVIHAWIVTLQSGLVPALKGIRRIVVHAVGPEAVLLYMVGLVPIAVVPYLLLFVLHIRVDNAWGEFWILAGRIGLAVVFALMGWTTTVGALARNHAESTDNSG